ncbi:MAG: preprotein translocase subunit SecY [Candidatus Bathyarchaeia archaeon]|nr:preprotein translocase subunit SecY [Candidatus Bathyarchaeota archaeon]
MPRFIEIFKPFIKYLPDIKKPERITFNEKLVWTAIALILYLIMSEVPLYGVGKGGAQDPLGALRVIFASSRGTLMELGIGPIVTGGLILQILSGSKMIDVDMTNPEDRSLFTGASKILAVLMTIFEALAYILGGAYGPLKVQTQIAILSQLVASGLILILLDEMLQKGWGLGSGISLFIAAGVAQRIWWDMVAPMGPMQDGKFLGALIAFTQSLQLGEGIKALYRGGGLPDMVGLLTTVAVVIIVIYVNGLKVSVPVSYAKYRGFRGAFPIKFLYTSNIPVIFAAALMGNIYFITQILWQRYNQTNTNFWLNLLGTYKVTEGHIEPTGGLIYYLAPPRSLTGLLGDPFRAAVYAGLFILMCIFFSVTWVEVGGMDPKTVAKQLIDSGMQIEGFRRSSLPIQQLLSRYIPTVTVLGGATVGAIAASADFLGAFGSGTGILLTVGILEQYYQILVKERMSEMFPALRGFLGE